MSEAKRPEEITARTNNNSKMLDPLTHVAHDQHILVKLPSENYKICFTKKDGVIGLGKFGSFNVNDIIGYPLGTTFDIIYDASVEETPCLTEKPVEKSKSEEVSPAGDAAEDSEPQQKKQKHFVNKPVGEIVPRLGDSRVDDLDMLLQSSETNKDLINLGSKVQKLSSEEIEKLKEASVDGNSIIQKLLASHENFHQKTVYSQEKYLKRKQKKFAKNFTVHYLSSAGLLQYLFDKGDNARINDMSIESMSMLLNLSNIQPSGNYLMMDESGGLLVYALMERMFGGRSDFKDSYGSITLIHESEHANLDLLKYSNYSPEFIAKHLKTISVWEFFEPSTKQEIEKDFTRLTDAQINKLHPHKKGTYHRKLKWLAGQLQLLEIATKTDYDGLVLNTTLYLPSLVPKLGTYLHGSRPIVCFSQYKETVLDLAHTLKEDLRYLAPSVMETKCRPYQSIRGKIHPVMTMRGGGGYLLWCQRVLPADEELLDTEDDK